MPLLGVAVPTASEICSESLLFCSEEAEFVLSDIRTVFMNGAEWWGVTSVLMIALDRLRLEPCFAFSRMQRLCIALKNLQISDHLLG